MIGSLVTPSAEFERQFPAKSRHPMSRKSWTVQLVQTLSSNGATVRQR
ncbi:hypothetical protein [Rhodanobacter thiooxydans]|nr:hypothetical protein [Rhodanobacter thiooxydans]MCW0202871.1 hypothetical protein [Rhodanobacter thiooxydans]